MYQATHRNTNAYFSGILQKARHGSIDDLKSLATKLADRLPDERLPEAFEVFLCHLDNRRLLPSETHAIDDILGALAVISLEGLSCITDTKEYWESHFCDYQECLHATLVESLGVPLHFYKEARERRDNK